MWERAFDRERPMPRHRGGTAAPTKTVPTRGNPPCGNEVQRSNVRRAARRVSVANTGVCYAFRVRPRKADAVSDVLTVRTVQRMPLRCATFLQRFRSEVGTSLLVAIRQSTILKTRNSKLETRNSKLETRNSKLETRNSKLETRLVLIPAAGQSHVVLPRSVHFSNFCFTVSRVLCTMA